MRHRKSTLRLPYKPAYARMMLRNLVTSLLLYESVRTTKKRAKAMSSTVDRLITIAKKRPVHVAIRLINRHVTDKNASRKIMEVYKARYNDRPSGFTRIVPAGLRQGDGAELVDISFVEGNDTAPAVDEAPKKEQKAKKEPVKASDSPKKA